MDFSDYNGKNKTVSSSLQLMRCPSPFDICSLIEMIVYPVGSVSVTVNMMHVTACWLLSI